MYAMYINTTLNTLIHLYILRTIIKPFRKDKRLRDEKLSLVKNH